MKQTEKRTKKRERLARKLTRINIVQFFILGVVIMLVAVGLFLYSTLRAGYEDTRLLAHSAADLVGMYTDVPGLVDEVVRQERSFSDAFEETMRKYDPEAHDGQLINYRWYTEQGSPLAERGDYQKVADTFLALAGRNRKINGMCLMVFDKETHIAALLADVEKLGAPESTLGDYVLWRRFEDIELDHIEEERGSLLKNLCRYMRIDPSYVAFAWYEPFAYADDNVVVFVEADAFYASLWVTVGTFLLIFSVTLLAVVLVMGALFSRRTQRLIVEPIKAIAVAAGAYTGDRRAGVRDQPHFSALELHTGDELEDLVETMAEMEREVGTFEDHLRQITAETERVNTELALATRIQADMLPNIFPAFPERREFEIHASMTPAKEVGGDFYDFYLIDRDHLGLVIADVSGKGIPAAMFMMMAKSMLQTQAMAGHSPRQVLTTVNNLLCANNREKMFVTVWLGSLDLNTGVLTAASAGHEYPILKAPGEPFEIFRDKHGFVLGGMKNMKYTEYEIRLEPGSRLFVYTDGVPEAKVGKEMFGMERTVAALNSAGDASPAGLLAAVDESVRRFVGDAEQFDDLTMLCLEYLGPDGKADHTDDRN